MSHKLTALICMNLLILSVTPVAAIAAITATKPASTVSEIESDVNKALDKITPAKNSVLNKKWKEESIATNNTLTIALFEPTYILPVYYTANPYYSVYQNNTPDQQRIERGEFKSQLSFYVPVIRNLFYDPNKSLNISYTQLNYWQVYASSQYFRETNYMPQLFFENHFHSNWLFRLAINHQSNGRGGNLERSWNRLIETLELSGDNWLISLNVWQLIFQGGSSDVHNPDIAHYLGYENILFTRIFYKVRASLQLQNLESALQRGSMTFTLSYPITKHFSLYGQLFSGYGQSLIEYDHHTRAAGIGIAFNDWI